MHKTQMPHMPGVGAVADTLDFVKNLWGSMSVPGMSIPGFGAPALSVDDLDKKIADLKAVESWLNVNLSMLHGTIQALEIQRGTLATLKTMGASMAEAMKQPGADQQSVLAATPFASAFFSQPHAATPAKAQAKPDPKPEPKPAAEPTPPAPEAQAPAASAFMPDPTVWWNLLQDQFKQAVSGAMASDAMASASAMAQEATSMMTTPASAKAAAKPAAADEAAGAPAKPRAAKAKPDKR